jgi:protein-tyrosine phosphatase
MAEPIGVLFVCMGNICRSPVARCVFEDLSQAHGVRDRFVIDSCGMGGWHAGEGADPRSVEVAAVHGHRLIHTARKVRPGADFDGFHYLLAMDLQNKRDLLHAGAPKDRVHLMRSFDPALAHAADELREVPDPYYGGEQGFEAMYQMLDAACRGLLEQCLRGR